MSKCFMPKIATAAILDFAAKHGITQIFVGHSQQTGLDQPLETRIQWSG